MESLLGSEILKSIGEGNPLKGGFLILVFLVIWLEVRALKRQFRTFNDTIKSALDAGEVRFKIIENDVHQIREDVDGFKKQLKPLGST